MERSARPSGSYSGGRSCLPPPPEPSPSPGRGVCMMSTSWRDKQHPNLINYIAAFLAANSYRLNILSISPDFIFNNRGLSVAFIFETSWDCENEAAFFSRVNALKRQFQNLYVVVTVPTKEQNELFNISYFRYDMELGCPTFVPVTDPEMGFEKMLKIAHARGGFLATRRVGVVDVANRTAWTWNWNLLDCCPPEHTKASALRQVFRPPLALQRDSRARGLLSITRIRRLDFSHTREKLKPSRLRIACSSGPIDNGFSMPPNRRKNSLFEQMPRRRRSCVFPIFKNSMTAGTTS